MNRTSSGRPIWHAANPRTGGRSVAVLLAVSALVATCGGPAPTTSPTTTRAPDAASPGPGLPAVTPSPPPVSGDWGPVELAPLVRVASLQATRSGAAGAALDTAFRLTSLDGRDPVELASHLVAEPALQLRVGKASGDSVLLTPAAPLRRGQLYRLALQGPTAGTAEATWTVQAVKPLEVVTSIPYDEATGVPRDTGIEVTFDQLGVSLADAERYVEVSPATAGRFELHGRTVAFVPDRPLERSTLYTITVRHGLPLEGTGMRLEQDAVIRFETEGRLPSRVHMRLTRPLFDAATNERAALIVSLDEDYDDEDEDAEPERVGRLGVQVHRLAGLGDAIRAYEAIEAAPDWTWLTRSAPVATGGLPLAFSGRLPVNGDYEAYLRLPKALRAGWYVVTVTHAGVPRQAVLQVADLATYATVTTTRTAAWVNDLRTDDPVAGARVSIAGRRLGVTGDDGLLVHRTPAAVREAVASGSHLYVVVRHGGRATFVPIGSDSVCEKCEVGAYATAEIDRWWQLFTTDRYSYRQTDTVNLWGVVRDRASGSVPASVAIDMFVQDWSGTRDVPIASTSAAPDRTGSFVARLPVADLPPGDYALQLRVGQAVVTGRSVHVGPIVKPAWSMTLDTDRHAVISGESVTATLHAAFFEGTPVVGAEVRLGMDYYDEIATPTTVITDADGGASGQVLVVQPYDDPDEWTQTLYAHPTAPEEGEIYEETRVAVFPASALVDVSGTLDGTRLVVSGLVSDVAFERYEQAGQTSLSDVDPRGDPRPGATVEVRIVERVPVVRQTGTRYDIITKRVVPVYEVDEREVDLGARSARTASDGTFRIRLEVTGGKRSYSIEAVYEDEAGRAAKDEAWASAEASLDGEYEQPYLDTTDGEYHSYGIGDMVRFRFRGGARNMPVSRYLYLVSHQGLRSATVSDSPRFATRFDAAAVPTLHVAAVRFTGTGYEPAWPRSAAFREEDRKLGVELTPDASSYAPGDRATIIVRTTGPDGQPVPASVYVRVIDERLYAIEGAEDDDPLTELYSYVGDGVLATAWSHGLDIRLGGGEGGDTTGGGGEERSDFRDWLAAELVTTGRDGTASLTVRLSDDLTSWRVVGQAVDRNFQAGIGTGRIEVGLPLFAEATIAAEYLAADRPVIRVRAYGGRLTTGDQVTFRISSDTLPMAEVTRRAPAFQVVEVPLPALTPGEHRIRIRAATGSGASAREDVLVRTFRVVESRTVRGRTTYAPLTPGMTIESGTGLGTLTLVDAGRGRVIPVLESLVWGAPDRADRAIAAVIAADTLRRDFGLEPGATRPDADLGRFQRNAGVGIVSWADADLELSVLAALSGADGIDRDMLHWYFEEQPERETGDRAILRLAGRAALGEPVLAEVRTVAATPDLTTSERLALSIAALAAGDEDLAATLERGLLEELGQRLGPWVRLQGITGLEDAVATARLAVVAASLGDPVAADMDAYVEANPPKDTVVDLERAIAAHGWAARVPGSDAVAAVTIDGRRQEVAIAPDRPAALTLTPAQVAGLRLDPVSGSVLVVSSREVTLDPGTLARPAGLTLERSVTPAGAIGPTDTVVVTYRVTLGRDADDGCWLLTDFAPSGLAPIGGREQWYDEDEEEEDGPSAPPDVYPWRVEGQRVDFCVQPDPKQGTHRLRYIARVVTPGTYRWESAVLQSSIVRDQGAVVAPAEVTIRGLAR